LIKKEEPPVKHVASGKYLPAAEKEEDSPW